jgi:hypothetical protein
MIITMLKMMMSLGTGLLFISGIMFLLLNVVEMIYNNFSKVSFREKFPELNRDIRNFLFYMVLCACVILLGVTFKVIHITLYG